LDPKKTRPTVRAQREREGSLLHHVRRLIALRKREPALGANGKMKPLYAEPGKYPFVYLRRLRRQKFVVAVNPSKEPVTVDFDVPGAGGLRCELGRGARASTRGGRFELSMAGVSYGIFRVE
jgi:maltose alpha-D-glucosyltransferase/alpha-amylase